jgi:hypothetical protein
MKKLIKISTVYSVYYYPTGQTLLLESKPKKKDLKAIVCEAFDFNDEEVSVDDIEVTKTILYKIN